jgi:micrococcal nuclease
MVVTLVLSMAGNGYLLWQRREIWRVNEVVDGDTLRLKDGSYVRLEGFDAPELGECMGQTAKDRLTQMTMGKVIDLKEGGWDKYNRRLGVVTAGGMKVAEVMLSEGLGQYSWVKDYDISLLKMARDGAIKQKIGIWSTQCGYDQKATNGCVIKGNSRHGNGKIYTMPRCPNYDQVVVEENVGDQYFCSEEEATRAGYAKAGNCLR